MEKVSIKSWALDDRPREKMLLKGKESLSDAELIAILIGSGNREESAVDLAKRILRYVNNNLNKLTKLSIEELMQFKGIGNVKAITIVTALEFGKRRQFEDKQVLSKITSSSEVMSIMSPVLYDLDHEEFWVLYLNNANKVISKQQVSKGGLTATLVDVRIIFKKAMELNSVGIILCHNHPSGKLKPSKADIELTNKVKMASSTLDIKLLDHLIISEKTYFSFADEGIL
ncbi:DNA repair protein RadC [Tenacibaculum sp. MAR_2009_124]|uniref:RadC family protein n=1 Tax=Tenacibaculum sp. MAR_2009_124 TaxID=1250059 RepID=UPI000894DE47|nr:DNA repair protein RadC [Tenacibaculum sp. MAR_2009_124]SEC85335.1 DNA repair protein RadC [Tenacibaculum sp. MAR_2009_124]